jgi:DNA-binding NarL/FixJ family response regulator
MTSPARQPSPVTQEVDTDEGPADDRPIRILLVDDHPVVRVGLRAVLEIEPDLEVVGDADTVDRALVAASRLRPDLILLDVMLPDGSGIEACREIHQTNPNIRVLMLTSFGDETAVIAAMMAGASGYLLKNAPRADLLAAIRAVAGGATLLDPAVARLVQQRLTNPPTAAAGAPGGLSEREREVIALVAAGLTNVEIGERLDISDKTARNHVSNILVKLGLARRSEAAAYAVRHGIAGD